MNRPTAAPQRRLAAFFCADVAGYSRLMAADESATLRLLGAYREITDREIAQHSGRIANTAGDSILAEFPSATDAVQCALAIQARIAQINDAVPEERRVTFRIGVHVGEAMVRGGDLFGDGVNVAARLQSLATPGTICLSDSAYDYARRSVALEIEDLGPQLVKNMDQPIRAFLAHPAAPSPTRTVPLVHSHFEIHLIRRVNILCTEALTAIAATADLVGIDVPALASIIDEPGLSPPQLARRLGIKPAAAERCAGRLERRGLIRKVRSTTGRLWALTATPEGVETRLRLRADVRAEQDRIFAPLSEHDRSKLKDLLVRVIEASASRSAR